MASLELGARLERESARRAEGITDPMAEHRRKLILHHLSEFICKVKNGNRCPSYVHQLETRIKRIIDGVGAE